jgi:single-stranded-DNA-specific exonuclease
MSFPLKSWQTIAGSDDFAASLAAELEIPLPIAKVLAARGLEDAEQARTFLNPRLSSLGDPFGLPDMEVAVTRIWQAIDQQEKMLVFGDYDVDGVCSTALLFLVLEALGGKVRPFLPHRLNEGYGLQCDSLHRCMQAEAPRLILTVDCGTGSVDAVASAAEAGVDVIVTDHHEPDGDVAPALAVVNPKLGDNASQRMLAGVGVAFKLCHAMIKRGMDEGRQKASEIDLREFLDLVAVATVADMVPLQGENRILARHGLKRLNEHPRRGFEALREVAGVKGRLEAYHIGFVIGPRLNAAGRLGDAELALRLLLEEGGTASELARDLDGKNTERREIESAMCREAIKEADERFDASSVFGVVVGRVGWHIGTIGIVASRLCSRFYRPSIVIGIDEVTGQGRGSCRSIDSVDVLDVLRECDDLLINYGGHQMAAGLDIAAKNLDRFRDRFNDVCKAKLGGQVPIPEQRIDAWIGLGEADERLLRAVDQLRPFGSGNQAPTWGVRGVRVASVPRRLGKDGNHVKFMAVQGGSQLEAIGFNMGKVEFPEGPIDIVFQLRENTFRGRTSVEMHIKDLRPADDPGGAEGGSDPQ